MRMFTKEDDEAIVRMWREGATIREIAAALRRSMGSVACRMYLLRKERPDELPYRVLDSYRDNIARGRDER